MTRRQIPQLKILTRSLWLFGKLRTFSDLEFPKYQYDKTL